MTAAPSAELLPRVESDSSLQNEADIRCRPEVVHDRAGAVAYGVVQEGPRVDDFPSTGGRIKAPHAALNCFCTNS